MFYVEFKSEMIPDPGFGCLGTSVRSVAGSKNFKDTVYQFLQHQKYPYKRMEPPIYL